MQYASRTAGPKDCLQLASSPRLKKNKGRLLLIVTLRVADAVTVPEPATVVPVPLMTMLAEPGAAFPPIEDPEELPQEDKPSAPIASRNSRLAPQTLFRRLNRRRLTMIKRPAAKLDSRLRDAGRIEVVRLGMAPTTVAPPTVLMVRVPCAVFAPPEALLAPVKTKLDGLKMQVTFAGSCPQPRVTVPSYRFCELITTVV